MLKDIVNKSKRIILGTLTSLALLSSINCRSIHISDVNIKHRPIRRFTEEVIKQETEKTKIVYTLATNLDSNILNTKASEYREREILKIYEIVTKEEYEIYKAKLSYNPVYEKIFGSNRELIGYVPSGIIRTTTISSKPKREKDNQRIYDGPAKRITLRIEDRSDKIGLPFESVVFCRTDNNGETNLRLRSKVNDWDLSRENLWNKIINNWKVKGIKEPLRSKLLSSIKDLVESDNEYVRIRTNEKNPHNMQVYNDSEIVVVQGVSINYDKILDFAREIIDTKINSKIKTTKITVEDSNSHIGIPNVNLEMKVVAPTRLDLVDDYFTGKLLDWAISQIDSYRNGESSQCTDRNGTIRFNVYTPSGFEFETRHSEYHAFEKSTTFKPGNLEKTIRLVDIGQKIRTEEVEKRGGGLIEK